MRKISFLLLLLVTLIIAGCATDSSDTGGYRPPSRQHGPHH